jgi:hypothetical protein
VAFAHPYAGDVAHNFATEGHTIDAVQQQSEERGGKAARAVKTIDALVDQVEQSQHESGGTDTKGERMTLGKNHFFSVMPVIH